MVLHSLRNAQKRFPLFVARRLIFISNHTCISNWKHVPSKLNSADLLSRGCRADKLIKTQSWFSGPEFLYKSPQFWPSLFESKVFSEEDLKVFDKKPAVSAFFGSDVNFSLDQVISNFSSLFKLKRAIAWLLKFKEFIMHQKNFTPSSLSVSDLLTAEAELIKYEQRNNFGDIISKMKNNEDFVLPLKSPLSKLNPILSDGILRVGGRLNNATVSYDLRHPIILPFSSHLTNLIVFDSHCVTGHGGVNMTLNHLTNRFWICIVQQLFAKSLSRVLSAKDDLKNRDPI